MTLATQYGAIALWEMELDRLSFRYLSQLVMHYLDLDQ
jgi:hypothetical protein